MPTLTSAQLASLGNTLTNNGVAAFYSELMGYGDQYASLAYAVTTNQGWQGQLANAYASIGAEQVTYNTTGWQTLNYDIASAYLARYQNGDGVQPAWNEVQVLHNTAYANLQIPLDNWFPNKMLNESSDPEALWHDWLSNDNSTDIFQDGIAIIRSENTLETGGTGEHFIAALYALDIPAQAQLAQDLGLSGLYLASWLDYSTIYETFHPTNVILTALQALFSRAETERPDPLVVDLNGDGVIGLNGASTVYFDMNDDNFAEAVNWVSASDGLLVRDGNANGVVDGANELFGNAAEDGFSVLSFYDSNEDNIIDANDAVWASLRVWQDINQDGYSQEDELLTLSSLGFTSINLGSVSATSGNPDITHEGTITTASGTVKIANVLFDADNVNTRYDGDYTLDIETLFLPTLRGYGKLPDLHIAANDNVYKRKFWRGCKTA